jgi:hypothetical protein
VAVPAGWRAGWCVAGWCAAAAWSQPAGASSATAQASAGSAVLFMVVPRESLVTD